MKLSRDKTIALCVAVPFLWILAILIAWMLIGEMKGVSQRNCSQIVGSVLNLARQAALTEGHQTCAVLGQDGPRQVLTIYSRDGQSESGIPLWVPIGEPTYFPAGHTITVRSSSETPGRIVFNPDRTGPSADHEFIFTEDQHGYECRIMVEADTGRITTL